MKKGIIIVADGIGKDELIKLKSEIIHFCSMDICHFVILAGRNQKEIERELRYLGIVFYCVPVDGSLEECWEKGLEYLSAVCGEIYAYAAGKESVSFLIKLKGVSSGNVEILEGANDEKDCCYGTEQELWPQVRVRLMRNTRFFGPGVADLMRQIQFTDSVKTACERLGMSYSKGMQMIRRAEQEMHMELVMRRQGGAFGGMAELTEEGKKLLQTYEEYEQAVKKYAEEIFHNYF